MIVAAMLVLAPLTGEHGRATARGAEPGGQKDAARVLPRDGAAAPVVTEATIRQYTDVIRLRMAREEFEALCAAVPLSEDQQRYGRVRFGVYEQRLKKIEDDVFEEILPAALALAEAMQSGEEPGAAEKVQLAESFDRQLNAGRPRVVGALETLLSDLRTCLGESQAGPFEAAVRAWRRGAMLNLPFRAKPGKDLACHIDPFEMIDRAIAEHEGLAALLDPEATAGADPALQEARRQCLAIFAAFEMRLDDLLPGSFRRRDEAYQRARRARMAGDDAAVRRFNRQYIDDWLRIYRLNTSTAEALAAAIIEAGEHELAEQWREQYYAAYFPELYADDPTDLLAEMLLADERLDDVQRDQIEPLYGQYVQQRKAARRNVRRKLLELVETMQMHASWLALWGLAGQLPDDWYATLDALCALSAETNARFRAVLTDEAQQRELDAAAERFLQMGPDWRVARCSRHTPRTVQSGDPKQRTP